MLTAFAGLMHVDDPAPSDAIVVLLGSLGHRCPKVAELYAENLAPLVLVTSETEFGGDQAERHRRELIDRGVPVEAIRFIPGAVGSTRDEAQRTRDYLRRHPSIRRITVVTCGFHTARASWVFRKAFRGMGVDVRMAAAPASKIDPTNWYTSPAGRRVYLYEAMKIAYYRFAYSF